MSDTCYEGVSRAREFQPCGKPAVAMRYDQDKQDRAETRADR